MKTIYSNILLTIIALCVAFQAAIAIWPLHAERALPVTVKGFSIGEETIPVSVKESRVLQVNIHDSQLTLPVSIDAVSGRKIGTIGERPLPVQLSR